MAVQDLSAIQKRRVPVSEFAGQSSVVSAQRANPISPDHGQSPAMNVPHQNNSASKEGDLAPDWTLLLNECLLATKKELTEAEKKQNQQLLNPDLPLPFEEMLLPFVAYAGDKLKKKCSYAALLEKPAQVELERSLLTCLSSVNSFVLEHEFAIFRAVNVSSLLCKLLSRKTRKKTRLYKQFVRHFSGEVLPFYLAEYPVLGKYVSTAIQQWIDVMAEMINRFENDKQRIREFFFEGKDPGKIVHIKTSLSDRHNGGRRVLVLQFESGVSLVYKPRDISIEMVWNNLLSLLNEMGAPVDFKTFTVLKKEGYGWVQFVVGKPVENGEARLYYKRAGGLLCLAYLLGATDLHYENIISHGDFPVIVDLETLLHPLVHHAMDFGLMENAGDKAKKILIDSVVRSGLLPHWQLANKNSVYDVSGLGKFLPPNFCFENIKWRDVNSDAMQVRRERAFIRSVEGSSVAEKYEALNLNRFSREIVQGFVATYRFLMQRHNPIMQSSGWQAFAGLTVRFVFRPTQVYFQLQQNLLQPTFLSSFKERSTYLETVLQASAGAGSRPLWWPLLLQEIEALKAMDTPHFTTLTDTDALTLPDGSVLEHYFAGASFAAASNRLENLNEQDLSRQVELIQGSLVCRQAEENHSAGAKRYTSRPKNVVSLTKEKALKQAFLIAARLKKQAIAGDDGSLTWIAPAYHPGAKRYRLKPISNDFYSGGSGIALFFAAIYKVSGQQEYKDLARQCLQMPCTQIREDHPSANAVGGFAGGGSLVYSLLEAGLLLEEEELMDMSRLAASRVTRGLIEMDRQYDLMYGAAGTILVLLKLYQHFPDQQLGDRIRNAGDHLLKGRTCTASGFRVWQSGEDAFLTGFSHGASGIAFALLQLYQLTGHKPYREAAFEAIGYEQSVFDAEAGNWPDFRKPESEEKEALRRSGHLRSAWCHGATGIGLARLGALRILDTEVIRQDITIAIETTKKHLLSGADHVCCGNMGRLELLLAAALHFSDNGLLNYTYDRAGTVVTLANENGDFCYPPQIGFTPGFFQGISGIGYQLLRITHPDILPSVLLLS